jgi:hypothetical protein
MIKLESSDPPGEPCVVAAHGRDPQLPWIPAFEH